MKMKLITVSWVSPPLGFRNFWTGWLMSGSGNWHWSRENVRVVNIIFLWSVALRRLGWERQAVEALD